MPLDYARGIRLLLVEDYERAKRVEWRPNTSKVITLLRDKIYWREVQIDLSKLQAINV